MPNRIIREGILSSERIEQLDWSAEVFYRRLMSKVDDHGLFDARAAMLRSSLYPLRVDRVREADIARWLAACETAGVIALYEHGGKPYGQMVDTRWQARSEPKHPPPPWGNGAPPPAVARNCAQGRATAPVFGVGAGGVDPPPPPLPGGAGFSEFWAAWPAHPRKAAKEQCRRKWQAQGCAAISAGVMRALEAAKASEAWKKDKGAFIPAPLVWLNQARWEAPTEAEAEAQRVPWWDTRSGIEAKGVELGIGKWDEDAAQHGRGIQWPTYAAQVMRAAGIEPKRAA